MVPGYKIVHIRFELFSKLLFINDHFNKSIKSCMTQTKINNKQT